MTLLRHTPKGEIKPRENLVVNPAKTCQPIGAMYAALGIHGCLPHSHGSQGCCSYHRSTLTRHYKDPVMASTSSFTEGTAVFGGQSNLLAAFETIFDVYDPAVIAVHTTCLSETIGDDIPQITKKAIDDGKVPEGKVVFHANTPSYVGTHITGYANMVEGMVKYLTKSTGTKGEHAAVIPGWVEPADMRELKRIVTALGVEHVLFPDTDGVFDAPMTGKHVFYPKGGAKIEDIARAGDAKVSFALGPIATRAASEKLTALHGVEGEVLDLPIGLSATDRFVDAIRKAYGIEVAEEITNERGKLVDLITDMEQYLWGKKVAIFGDPDQLIALTEFLQTLGMQVRHVVTGTEGNFITKRLTEINPEANVKVGGDMFLLHQWMKNEPVDLLIGNTYGKYMARDEDVPFLRFGFPILDRQGHQHFPTVGYMGGIRLVEKILELLMDRIDRDAEEPRFELQM
ncbi:MAG: nitrogenase molybdenum-iron protein subunit beta [Fibrobacteria bacterium]|nr:nitrogenase molybdenum-iron protein subunit beta [Fibrobacteria bacterium]